jgi:hypothetical protein
MENLDHMDNYRLIDHLVLLDRCSCDRCQKEADKYRKGLREEMEVQKKLRPFLNKTFDKKHS